MVFPDLCRADLCREYGVEWEDVPNWPAQKFISLMIGLSGEAHIRKYAETARVEASKRTNDPELALKRLARHQGAIVKVEAGK